MIQPTASPARILAWSALLAAAATTVACASGPPGRPGGTDAPQRTAMFISPFGEPFMAEPGEPWPVSDWFIGADIDLDQAMTFEEFAADGRRWFGDLDQDRSGRLDQAELAAYEARLRLLAHGPGQGAPPQRRGGDRPAPMTLAEPAPQNGPPGRVRRRGAGGWAGGYGPVAEAGFFNLPQPVKAADINIDQRVTAEEWATATERWFLALDTDRDGRLTMAGLPRTPLQMRVEAGRR
ncbi:hypothetical protein [Brevundimonas sp.]|uniref:hypothetical protein n=1 Tax=Brevundimonas sp. TaxID=1871086 RepID=UPI002D53158A|nr:hypothetical protein [Brevundimonas sp.]HYC99156.1 hypothetical protein [Brevundimonas sp.]